MCLLFLALPLAGLVLCCYIKSHHFFCYIKSHQFFFFWKYNTSSFPKNWKYRDRIKFVSLKSIIVFQVQNSTVGRKEYRSVRNFQVEIYSWTCKCWVSCPGLQYITISLVAATFTLWRGCCLPSLRVSKVSSVVLIGFHWNKLTSI